MGKLGKMGIADCTAVLLLAAAASVQAMGMQGHSAHTLPVAEDDMAVALTFDDGPDPRYTQAVLDILNGEGVPGTFFLVGSRVEADAGRTDYAGHLIGYHTYTHERMLAKTPSQQVEDFERGAAAFPASYDTADGYYRGPRKQAWPSTVAWADRQGTYLLWSIAYDKEIRTKSFARGYRGTVMGYEDRVETFVSEVMPGDVVLMHDGNGNGRYLVEDLRDIIRELKSRGYRFATPAEFRDGSRVAGR